MQSNSKGDIPENLRRVLALLPDARPEGNEWRARCPAHNDTKPSLYVGMGDDGHVLAHCFGGCSFEAVVSALGLTAGDLAPMEGAPLSSSRNDKRRIVQVYHYRDKAGALLFQVVRYEPKDFRQRRPDPNKPGDWIWKLKGVPRVLYRLPELSTTDSAQPVFVCEGEKDADNVASLGLVSTTAPGGGSKGKSKWREEYNESLRGRRVVILPHNDEPGRVHAQAVARSVAAAAVSVKVLELPELPDDGGDVSDWLGAGGTAERLLELVDAAPERKPGDDPAPDDRPAIVRLCDVAPRPLEWLWPGRIPLGKLSLICGDPGTGKSLLVADLAARVSAGLAWPDAPAHRAAGDVWLISLEDDLADTIRPRLDAAGAAVSRVHALPEVFSLDAHLAQLDSALARTEGARLLVIDPIAACLGKVDSHKNADVRGALAPLALMAARRSVAVVCIHHLNKSAIGPALYRAAGSLAFAAAARAVWLVAMDRDDKRRRLLLPIKNNLAEALTGLAYCIEGDEARAVGRIVWDPRPIDASADEALAVLTPDDSHQQTLVEEAKEWLLEVMQGEPIGWDEVIKLAGKEHKEGTLRKARKVLQDAGIIAKEKRGNGRGSKWLWSLTDRSLPLFAGLNDSDAAEQTAPDLVELAKPKKPR